MAEAAPQPGRFFCHCCSAEIQPRLPDYICPRCESGFIEELPEETRSSDGSAAPSGAPAEQLGRPPVENADQHLFALPQGYGQFAFGIFDDSFELPAFPPGAPQAEDGRDPETRRERDPHSRQRYGARQPRARLTARRAGRHEGVPTLEGIIQQLVNGIITPATIPNLGLGPCSSTSLRTRGPRLQTRTGSRPSPPSPSRRSTWAPGSSVPCARTTMGWASRSGSCPATTSSTRAASCPGWSSMTAAPSVGRASLARTRPPTPRA
ncbi:E3 ubiquitin-protein ligase RNF126 isoform X3 [Erinaceus europaeus]|uniref:E3 ubiquitin-protein ligase RNF126 isoform X3 n=1 Tax=Erinaceus europaeus TaxID=9365 RepID=A0ABM3WLH4_ERIEU|nr:E3 ubiquitin-protein ligase RNF126 isoform X3 [Erinaceus europaeus]